MLLSHFAQVFVGKYGVRTVHVTTEKSFEIGAILTVLLIIRM
jgi:hypothetical protein